MNPALNIMQYFCPIILYNRCGVDCVVLAADITLISFFFKYLCYRSILISRSYLYCFIGIYKFFAQRSAGFNGSNSKGGYPILTLPCYTINADEI
jgi:hypothetical protein